MSSELSGKDVEYLLTNPATFGERRERKVVRVDFAKTCEKKRNKKIKTNTLM